MTGVIETKRNGTMPSRCAGRSPASMRPATCQIAGLTIGHPRDIAEEDPLEIFLSLTKGLSE